jgi:hypothetical protein
MSKARPRGWKSKDVKKLGQGSEVVCPRGDIRGMRVVGEEV